MAFHLTRALEIALLFLIIEAAEGSPFGVSSDEGLGNWVITPNY